jgi:hypothetical protein
MSSNSDNNEDKVRIWAWIPAEVHEEMESLRNSHEFPPSKTQFVIRIVEMGLAAYRKSRTKVKK